VNTTIIVPRRRAESSGRDGVLADWFRVPHREFGTSSRLINMLVIMQLVTIVVSRGDVYMLGEAYAFGVVGVSP